MAGSLHSSCAEASSVYFGHFTDGVPREHQEAFNLPENPEKPKKKKKTRMHGYSLCMRSVSAPHICSWSLRSDHERQDMTSSVTPWPEEVLQKKRRVHRGNTCTRDEGTKGCFSFIALCEWVNVDPRQSLFALTGWLNDRLYDAVMSKVRIMERRKWEKYIKWLHSYRRWKVVFS